MLAVTNRAAVAAVPGPAVLDAFGLVGDLMALPGGEGRSVQVDEVVLKPVDDVVEATWCAEVLDRVEQHGFRVARPVRARGGGFVAEGWGAARRVDGVSRPTEDWAGLLAAGRAFHAAVSAEPRPSFLERRAHRWAVADRVAWGEERIAPLAPVAEHFRVLHSLLRPVRVVSQVVHGDLSGNVLFAAGQAPAVIDFSPYWRPVAYADAIVAVDGLLWFGAGPELVELASSGADFPQMLVRAALFRLVALNEMARAFGLGVLEGELGVFGPVIDYVRVLAQ